MTQRFDCSDDAARREGIAAAAAAIRDGRLVILPTDTVYGIAADAFTPRAITGLLAAKGRGRAMPVPVLIADMDTLEGVATNLAPAARLLTRACWPGGLTLIVEHPPSLAWDLGDGQGTVAVRVPDDDLARDLLRETGPLGVSSANRSGRPPARTADEAIEQLGDQVAVVLDDGPRADGEPSTIVDCTVDPPRLLRVGAVKESRLHYLVPTLRTVTTDPAPPQPTAGKAESQGATQQMTSSTYWGPDFSALREIDPEIADVVLGELERLRGGLQLIASENFTSPAVLAALGSTLSNKYAEGYPGRRYYGGCAEVDKAEEIGIARAKELFGAEHANLQPHSGATANLAAYGAFMSPGDTLLGMALPHGGHLTHGSKVSFSGKWFNAKHYGVSKQTEHIDYDEVRDLAREHRPKVIVCGGSAIPRTIEFATFREIADEVGAILVVDAAHFIGLVAGQAIPSPVPYADVVTLTTHKVLRGPRGGAIVCKAEHAKAIDKAVFPMMQGGPLMHSVAAKAVNLKECQSEEYKAYARQVVTNAQALTKALESEGLRAVTGGTDTHLALLDVSETGVTGAEAEARCDAAGIVLNKNAIPYDPQPPSVASGVRVGSPSVTTQGMGPAEMERIAGLIGRAIRDATGDDTAAIAAEVGQLVAAHPAYPEPRA